eukprot:GCRY01001297.1.p1 GENE.GCRY01001297.1~~GCRY01001297.1.p1  ORF type:complete len:326 (-),score=37.24 GCRY01001297.1:117-980(-)
MSKRSLSKKEAIALAAKTLDIIKQGFYTNPKGACVDVKEQIDFLTKNTVLYEGTQPLPPLPQSSGYATKTFICECTTLEAVFAFPECSNSAILNFASARHPGGGFITGARAQEESLARSSGVYAGLTAPQTAPYYANNKRMKSCLYTDDIIYTPSVPIWFDDGGTPLASPILSSFVTAPAPNAGVVQSRGTSAETVNQTLTSRAKRVLQIMAAHGHQNLILGAWGCGVFRNDPEKVAAAFKALIETEFAGQFKHVIYAITNPKMCAQFAGAFQLPIIDIATVKTSLL